MLGLHTRLKDVRTMAILLNRAKTDVLLVLG